jgi:hypothetical protein
VTSSGAPNSIVTLDNSGQLVATNGGGLVFFDTNVTGAGQITLSKGGYLQLILENFTNPFAPEVFTLKFAGNYAHDVFSLSPDASGTGSYITVHPAT